MRYTASHFRDAGLTPGHGRNGHGRGGPKGWVDAGLRGAVDSASQTRHPGLAPGHGWKGLADRLGDARQRLEQRVEHVVGARLIELLDREMAARDADAGHARAVRGRDVEWRV